MQWLLGLDHDLLLFVNRQMSSPALTWLMRAVTDRANWIPVILAAAVLLLWMGRIRPVTVIEGRKIGRSWRVNPRVVLVCLVLSVSLADQAAYQIKHAVTRSRPCRDDAVAETIETRWHVSGNRSFPSSHAANSAALATVVSLAYPAAAVPACLLALAVGFSRIYLGVHYPLDVAAGWLLGFMSGGLVWLFLRKRARRRGIIGLANRFRVLQVRAGADPGAPWNAVSFCSADDFTLTGFLWRNGGKRVALLIHGLGGDIAGMLPLSELLSARGYDCLLVPLRGHDGHTCGITTGGPGEASDVLGAVLALIDMGYRSEDMLLYGCSMGGAAAVKAASILGNRAPGTIICHGTFDSFFGAARNRLGGVGAGILRHLMPLSAARGLEAFDPVLYLGLCSPDSTFVFMAGADDTICPPGMAHRLAGAAPVGRLIILGDSSHPVWLDSRMSIAQIGAAIDAAEGFRSGSLSGTGVLLDESGNLHMVPSIRIPDIMKDGQ